MREIPQERIDNEELTWDEYKYLLDRRRISPNYPEPEAPKAEEFKEDLGTKVTPLEEQSVPTIDTNGGIVDETEEEEYTTGWNNDQRRAELSRRGLNIQGSKDEMIARLRRSDTDSLLDDDLSEVG